MNPTTNSDFVKKMKGIYLPVACSLVENMQRPSRRPWSVRIVLGLAFPRRNSETISFLCWKLFCDFRELKRFRKFILRNRGILQVAFTSKSPTYHSVYAAAGQPILGITRHQSYQSAPGQTSRKLFSLAVELSNLRCVLASDYQGIQINSLAKDHVLGSFYRAFFCQQADHLYRFERRTR